MPVLTVCFAFMADIVLALNAILRQTVAELFNCQQNLFYALFCSIHLYVCTLSEVTRDVISGVAVWDASLKIF